MIKRKDGRWQEQVKLPGMAKPKYFYGKTQKEVRRKMAEWSQAEEEAKTKAVLFETVADAWATWKVEVEGVGWAAESSYKSPIADAKEWFGGRNINDIYADEIAEFLNGMAKKGLGKSAVGKRRSVLKGIWDYAILKRITRYNIIHSVKLPNNLWEGDREPPTDEQMERIRDGFTKEFGLFPLIQAFTGMRRGELLALEWEDFDWEKNIINVCRSVEFVNGTPRAKKPKTDAGKREISFLEQLKERLPRGRSGLVFKGTRGGYMHLYEYSDAWKRWCMSVGLAEKKKIPEGVDKKKFVGLRGWKVTVTSHQLRHYYATILYEAGVGEKDAQNLLGHADIQTTLNVYTHIRKRQKEAATEKLNEYLCQNVVKEQENVEK